MRFRLSSLGFLLLFGTATVLHADNDSCEPGPASGSGAAAAVDNSRPPSLSPAEMTSRASEMKARWEPAYDVVLNLRAEAQRHQDAIKLSCVNEKLIVLKAQMNIADTAFDELQGALASKSANVGDAYDKLSAASSGVMRSRDDARTCVGDQDLYKQDNAVTVTHPDLPLLPTQGYPFVEPIEPPAYASPFL